jgi:hypothetical protein
MPELYLLRLDATTTLLRQSRITALKRPSIFAFQRHPFSRHNLASWKDGSQRRADSMWVFNTRHDFGVETDPTQGEFFVNNDIDRSSALVRETIQNSLDARRDDASTVEVRFSFHEGALFLGPTLLNEYLSDLIPHLRACGLDLEGLDLHEPRFLVVEDFGTHGLRGNPASKEPSDFYFFWHVVGRSGKGDAKAGRWGLGKTVFPNSSQISAFFGYTIRSDDHRHLLLGQTCLKTHSQNGTTYLPYAFYQSSGPRQFELPFDDAERLAKFRSDFRLGRQTESGLSVVIPFPYRELNENSLIEAAIEHYFFPILAGKLVVQVNDRRIDRTTILALAAKLQSRKLRDIEKALKFAAELQTLDSTAIQSVEFPGRLNSSAGRVPSEAFAPDTIARLRQQFRAEQIIAVRVPVTLTPKTGPAEPTYITLYLKRDPSLLRGHDFYLRGGITLSGQNVFGSRPAFGLLLADDTPVCRFLGDAENPAHTLWNPRSPRIATRYRNPRETVMFIREAMVSLLDTLTQVSEEEDRAALSDIFFTPRKHDRQQESRETVPREAPPGLEDAVALPKFALWPVKGGFSLKGGPGLKPEDLPLSLTALTAYEIRSGNPFKKYNPCDYRLEEPPIHIVHSGLTDLRPSGQRVDFIATAVDFHLEVSGFDVHRDLKLRVEERSELE